MTSANRSMTHNAAFSVGSTVARALALAVNANFQFITLAVSFATRRKFQVYQDAGSIFLDYVAFMALTHHRPNR